MRYIFLLVLMVNTLFAITMTPLYHTIDDKRELKSFFTVKNPTNRPVAVKFQVLKLVDTDNNREVKVAASNVNYYPAQFVLDANASKNVRVTYMNKTLPKIEEVYRVIATELNVDVQDRVSTKQNGNKVSASLQLRFSYAGLLFVRDKSATSHLQVERFEKLADGSLEVVIANRGTASALFNTTQYNLKVMLNGKEYILDDNDVKGAEFRRVLPNKTNRYVLKHIQSLPQGKIESVKIEKI